MPTWRSLSLLLCTTWLGCSSHELPSTPASDSGVTDDSGPGLPDAGDAGPDEGPARTDAGTDAGPLGTDAGSLGMDGGTDGGTGDMSVRIKRFWRYATATGSEELPSDFTKSPVELFLMDGGTLVPLPGAAGEPGEYVFPDVPRVTYYLKTGSSYIITQARAVDMGVSRPYRADVEDLPPFSEVHLELSGLEPWQPRQGPLETVPELDFLSTELGFSIFLPDELDAGAVSTDEYMGLPLSRFEEARGDRAWVLQVAPRDLGPLPDGGSQSYLAVVRALHLPPFSYDGTEPLHIQGVLEALPLDELSLDWKATAFASVAADVNPAATLGTARFTLNPAERGSSEGLMPTAFDMLRIVMTQDGLSDISRTLVYGNPSPSTWEVVASASASFDLSIEIPGEPPTLISADVSCTEGLSNLATSVLGPRVLPPRGLTLDGTEAYNARALAPGAHMVSWQPPATGSVDAYVLRLQRLDKVSKRRRPVTVAELFVNASATSIELPAGLLQPGQHYFVTVEAVRSEGYEVAHRPLMRLQRISIDRASALSGLLSVPTQAP